jgi:hypothetical protein
MRRSLIRFMRCERKLRFEREADKGMLVLGFFCEHCRAGQVPSYLKES